MKEKISNGNKPPNKTYDRLKRQDSKNNYKYIPCVQKARGKTDHGK